MGVFTAAVHAVSYSFCRNAQEVFRKKWSQLKEFENTAPTTALYRDGAIYNYFCQNDALCPTEPGETNEVWLKSFFYCNGNLPCFELDMRN